MGEGLQKLLRFRSRLLTFREAGFQALEIRKRIPQFIIFIGIFALSINITEGTKTLPLGTWKKIISHRPDVATQQKLLQIIESGNWAQRQIDGILWGFLPIEYGWGTVNLDYYSVTITKMPLKNKEGNPPYTQSELLKFIRLNLNQLIDTSIAKFKVYQEDPASIKRWKSDDPKDTIIHIDLYNWGTQMKDATVWVTEATPHSWIFSTISTRLKNAHPVCGNREFGMGINASGAFYFYTIGSDRLTSAIFAVPSPEHAFDTGAKLWKSLQLNLVNWINVNGGKANIGLTIDGKTNNGYRQWKVVRKEIFFPSRKWLPQVFID